MWHKQYTVSQCIDFVIIFYFLVFLFYSHKVWNDRIAKFFFFKKSLYTYRNKHRIRFDWCQHFHITCFWTVAFFSYKTQTSIRKISIDVVMFTKFLFLKICNTENGFSKHGTVMQKHTISQKKFSYLQINKSNSVLQ